MEYKFQSSWGFDLGMTVVEHKRASEVSLGRKIDRAITLLLFLIMGERACFALRYENTRADLAAQPFESFMEIASSDLSVIPPAGPAVFLAGRDLDSVE